jgi:DNA-binding transcriptional regulator YhcF (GntR family)
MAIDAGVSHAAMGKAVGELRSNGILDVRQRRGIVLASVTPESPVTPSAHGGPHRWHRLKSQLHWELADGLFGSDRLPSQKELAGRYRVSPKTLSKALRSLVDDGVLTPEGKRYQVVVPARVSGRNTIVLFARGGVSGELVVYTSRTSAQFSVLEQLCSSRNVRLQVVLCQFEGTRLTFPGWESGSFAQAFEASRVLGFMVWHLGLTPDFTSELATRLYRLGKPTAIFCEDPKDLATPGLPSDPMVRQYAASADFQAGVTVGTFLIARGHRRICCWAEGSELLWGKERLAGIRRAFSDAGIADGVRSFSAWTDEYFYDSEKVQHINDHLKRTIERAAQELAIPVRSDRMTDIIGSLYVAGLYREHVFHALEPSMRQSLGSGDATAWVGMNDVRAMECLRYLQVNKVRVPERVSVIGFDDSPEAATHRMSSYNFNGVAAVNRMVDFLLWPNAPIVRSEAGRPVVVQGFVNERATTGEREGRRAK